MRILFDHCVNRRLARLLPFAEVRTARQMGWEALVNGALVRAADADGFDVLLTIDKNMEFQTPVADYRVAVLVLDCLLSDLDHLRPFVPAIEAAAGETASGTYRTLPRPA